MAELTAKQQCFVEEYLVDLNGTQAAIRAGYSPDTAYAIASENLRKPEIEQAIATAHKARLERTQIDADWILKRLALEATADIADIYDDAGHLKPMRQWPLIWRQGLVAGLETETQVERGEKGETPIVTTIRKVKLSDRIKRIELLGKHINVGAFAEKHEHTGTIETKDVTEPDLARRIAFALSQGLAATKPTT